MSSQKLSNLELWCLLTTYRKLCNWAFQKTHYWIPNIQDGWDPPFFSYFSAKGGSVWIKFQRLVQNNMSTAVMWSKSKTDVEFQYGGRFGEFNGMSSQSHMPHCSVQSPGKSNVMIVPGRKNSIRHIGNSFSPYFFLFLMQFRLWRAADFVSSPIHLLDYWLTYVNNN